MALGAPRPHPSAALVAGGLAVGVVAVSFSAILIRVAEAPALAIAFWRTLGGTLVLAPFALRARRGLQLDRADRRLLVASGAFLAAHFALWIGSLSFTTVGSSVTLVTVSPIFVGLGGTLFLSEAPTRRMWLGMGITTVGAAVIGLADLGAVDLGARAVLGDAMAFGGALAVTGYFLVGRALRRRALPNAVYAASVYGVAAALLLLACLIAGVPLAGYQGETWLAIAGLVVGPQLLGHTVFNALLSSVTATVVSIVVLAEPVGATLLAWGLLSELPAPFFWTGAPLILVGVFVAGARRLRPAPVG